MDMDKFKIFRQKIISEISVHEFLGAQSFVTGTYHDTEQTEL